MTTDDQSPLLRFSFHAHADVRKLADKIAHKRSRPGAPVTRSEVLREFLEAGATQAVAQQPQPPKEQSK